MKINISGSCKINEFQIVTMEKKISNLEAFLIGLEKVTVYFSKSESGICATLKGKVEFEEKTKQIIVHAEGKSKKVALKNVLVKLTWKYGKLCKNYTPKVAVPVDLPVAV